MTGFERIGSTQPVAGVRQDAGNSDAGQVARSALVSVGERVLAWTGASARSGDGPQAQWNARTGAAGEFAPSQAELARGGDVYQLRALTAEIAGRLGASPAEEGALGRAIEDFARAASMQFNGRGGDDGSIDAVAATLDAAIASGPGGIDGVTARIETAARGVEDLNR